MKPETIDYIQSTLAHIERVREIMMVGIHTLLDRARNHDQSKLRSPELEIFSETGDARSRTKYGTPEYEELQKRVQPALQHHWSKNRHHPEYHKDGINDMTVLDLFEMICDWTASSEGTQNGNIRTSLEVNGKRFGIDPQLMRILENTVKEMNITPKG